MMGGGGPDRDTHDVRMECGGLFLYNIILLAR